MTIIELIKIILKIGLPIIVSTFLLIKIGKQLKALSLSINTLNILTSNKFIISDDNK